MPINMEPVRQSDLANKVLKKWGVIPEEQAPPQLPNTLSFLKGRVPAAATTAPPAAQKTIQPMQGGNV